MDKCVSENERTEFHNRDIHDFCVLDNDRRERREVEDICALVYLISAQKRFLRVALVTLRVADFL